MTSFEKSTNPTMAHCRLGCGERGSCYLKPFNSSLGEIALANEHEANDILQSEDETLRTLPETVIDTLEARARLVQSLRDIAVKSCALNQE